MVIEILDVRALILLLILGHVITALLFFFATLRQAQIYDTIFMIGMALQGVGWFFLFFRGEISDILLFSFEDILIFSGFCLENLAFLSLIRSVNKRWQRIYAAIFALSLIIIWLPLLGHGITIGTVSFVIALFFLFPGFFLVFLTPRSSPQNQLTGSILLLNAITGISRGTYLLFAKYHRLFEQVNEAIFIADTLTRRFRDCNQQAEILTGYSYDEILVTADEPRPDDLLARTIVRLRGFLNGSNGSIETEVITWHGKRMPVSINGTPLELEKKRYLVDIFRDISWQKKVQKAIAERTEDLDRFFTTSLNLLCITDTDGYFRRLNPEWNVTPGSTLFKLEGQS